METCTIVTTDANKLLQHIHGRMPVIVAPADCERWLDPEATRARSSHPPLPRRRNARIPVSTRENRPEGDDAMLIEQVTP